MQVNDKQAWRVDKEKISGYSINLQKTAFGPRLGVKELHSSLTKLSPCYLLGVKCLVQVQGIEKGQWSGISGTKTDEIAGGH